MLMVQLSAQYKKIGPCLPAKLGCCYNYASVYQDISSYVDIASFLQNLAT
jgi:hypothetical protein